MSRDWLVLVRINVETPEEAREVIGMVIQDTIGDNLEYPVVEKVGYRDDAGYLVGID